MMRMKAEVEVKRRTERNIDQKLGGCIATQAPSHRQGLQTACIMFANSGPNFLSVYKMVLM